MYTTNINNIYYQFSLEYPPHTHTHAFTCKNNKPRLKIIINKIQGLFYVSWNEIKIYEITIYGY